MVIGDKLITDFIGLEEALNKLNRVYFKFSAIEYHSQGLIYESRLDKTF